MTVDTPDPRDPRRPTPGPEDPQGPAAGDDSVWADDQGGRLVRPFALIGGRTSPTQHNLDLFLMVIARQDVPLSPTADPEHQRILHLCRQPMSIAEVAAHRALPLSVAKVIISDLIDSNHLEAGPSARRHDQKVLQALLTGLQHL